MVSNKLEIVFKVLEQEAFQRWQKATQKEKDKIIKKLGVLEGKMIIKEIEKQSKL